MLHSAIGTICPRPPLLAAESDTPEWGQRLGSGCVEQEERTRASRIGLTAAFVLESLSAPGYREDPSQTCVMFPQTMDKLVNGKADVPTPSRSGSAGTLFPRTAHFSLRTWSRAGCGVALGRTFEARPLPLARAHSRRHHRIAGRLL